MTATAAYKIWLAAKRTSRNNLRIEDLYYLGILRHKAGIPETDVYAVGISTLSHNRCLHLHEAELYTDTSKKIIMMDAEKLDFFDCMYLHLNIT